MNAENEPFRLHVGGGQNKEGWTFLNIQPSPDVDYLGDCSDLSEFPDESCDEIYASHVLEHLGYDKALPATLKGLLRILKPDGRLMISVPDMDVLCPILVNPDMPPETRFLVMRMMFGGREDPHDVHLVGLNEEILSKFLAEAGFAEIQRLPKFNIFDDTSSDRLEGELISLNVTVTK